MPKKIQSSSKKTIQNKLSQLDTLGASLTEFDSPESAVEVVAGEFIKRVQQNIETANINVTGKINDIRIEPTANGVNITAPAHLVYQDIGVSGTEVKFNTPYSYKDKMPPISIIKEWIRNKGIISLRNEEFHGKKTDISEGAAWAIAKNIQKKGIKPKDLYSKEFPRLVEDVQQALGDFATITLLNALGDSK